jgi:hypothetical protein
MRRSIRTVAVLALILAAASACQIGGEQSASGPPGQAAGSTVAPAASAPTLAASAPAGDDDAAFCALAKQTGMKNLNVFDGNSTTEEQAHQVLANIDALTAAAPAVIKADFQRFDKLEHALFDAGGTPDVSVMQEAGGAEVRDALQHIVDYLKNQCGIAMQQ